MQVHDLLCVGDVGLDAYRGEPAPRPGGCALNVAWHLADEQAGRVGVCSVVGQDGEPLRALLRARGVDVEPIRVLPGATPCQEIEVLPDGERRFHTYTPGVLAGWLPDAPQEAAIRAARLVYLPVWSVTRPLLERVLAVRTGPLALDLMNLSDLPLELAVRSLERAAFLFAGLDRERHADAIATLQRAAGACTLVITLGAGGAIAVANGERAQVAAAPIPGGTVVDTTGCGDSFAAAFLAARGRGLELRAALERGTLRAARVAAHRGAVPQ